MSQVYSPVQTKINLGNNIFSYIKNNKKKTLPLALTPLLAACEGITLVIPPTPNSNDQLIAQGFTVYRSPTYGNDIYTGQAGKDAIFGANGNDVFNGLSGDDLIYGSNGNDILNGGTGADEIYGGAGNDYITPGVDLNYDYINGGSGVDTVSYFNNFGVLNISLITGDVHINGGFEDKLISIENVDGGLNATNIIYGNALDNILSGGNLNDFLSGSSGNDILEGNNGDDRLIGGDGNDELIGGAGEDVLEGGRGSDKLTGGAGVDIFKFSTADISGALSNDIITDFNLVDDFIDFSDLDFINSFTDVSNNMVQDGNDVVIFMHGLLDYTVTIENMTTAQLAPHDFLFV